MKESESREVLSARGAERERRRLDSAYLVTLRKIYMMSAKARGQAT